MRMTSDTDGVVCMYLLTGSGHLRYKKTVLYFLLLVSSLAGVSAFVCPGFEISALLDSLTEIIC